MSALDKAWDRFQDAVGPDYRGELTFYPPSRNTRGEIVMDWTARYVVQTRSGGRGRSRYYRAYGEGETPAEALGRLAEDIEIEANR